MFKLRTRTFGDVKDEMSKLRRGNDSHDSNETTIRAEHLHMSTHRLSQNRFRQKSGFDTVQKVMSMLKPILFGLTPANSLFLAL